MDMDIYIYICGRANASVQQRNTISLRGQGWLGSYAGETSHFFHLPKVWEASPSGLKVPCAPK